MQWPLCERGAVLGVGTEVLTVKLGTPQTPGTSPQVGVLLRPFSRVKNRSVGLGPGCCGCRGVSHRAGAAVTGI